MQDQAAAVAPRFDPNAGRPYTAEELAALSNAAEIRKTDGPLINPRLTDDERDQVEADYLGVTLEEYRASKAILKNTPQIKADAPVTDAAADDGSGGAGALEPAPSRADVAGRYDDRGRAVMLGFIPGYEDLEVMMANRLTSKGWADVPIVLQHLGNGTSRELDDGELADLRPPESKGGEA